jgi:hypothetical protein
VETRTTIRSPGSHGLPAHEIVLLLWVVVAVDKRLRPSVL